MEKSMIDKWKENNRSLYCNSIEGRRLADKFLGAVYVEEDRCINHPMWGKVVEYFGENANGFARDGLVKIIKDKLFIEEYYYMNAFEVVIFQKDKKNIHLHIESYYLERWKENEKI